MVRFPVTAHTSLYINGSFAVRTDVRVPRLPPGATALSHLRKEGYVVLENMNASEVAYARELLFAFLEGMGRGVRREAPETWVRSRPNTYGIVWSHGVGHSRLAWFVRTRPRLLEMFRQLFDTPDLISSFEGFSWLPPVAYESEWRLGEAWFHTDQNGLSRPGRQTIQSFTSLYDQDETTGALVVVPRSHKRHGQVTRRVYAARPSTPADQQFLMLPPNDPILSKPRRPHLVRVKAGDSVLWDSRMVHCSTPALHSSTDSSTDRLTPSAGEETMQPSMVQPSMVQPSRVVVYASLAPRRLATDAVLLARQRALCTRVTCTHWPFEMSCLPPPAEMGEVASDPLTHVLPLHKELVGYTQAQLDSWVNAGATARLKERTAGAGAACPPHADAHADDANVAGALFSSQHPVTLARATRSQCPRRAERRRRPYL